MSKDMNSIRIVPCLEEDEGTTPMRVGVETGQATQALCEIPPAVLPRGCWTVVSACVPLPEQEMFFTKAGWWDRHARSPSITMTACSSLVASDGTQAYTIADQDILCAVQRGRLHGVFTTLQDTPCASRAEAVSRVARAASDFIAQRVRNDKEADPDGRPIVSVEARPNHHAAVCVIVTIYARISRESGILKAIRKHGIVPMGHMNNGNDGGDWNNEPLTGEDFDAVLYGEETKGPQDPTDHALN